MFTVPPNPSSSAPAGPSEAAAPLLRLLGLAYRQMAEALHERLADGGFADLRVAHGAVFANVAPEGTRLTDLAERAGMTKQAMSELVADLEHRGYVHRTMDPTDGRAKLIGFTDQGWAAVTAALQIFAAMDDDLAQRLGDARLRQLRRTLLQLLEDPQAG